MGPIGSWHRTRIRSSSLQPHLKTLNHAIEDETMNVYNRVRMQTAIGYLASVERELSLLAA